jgi:uncharacterized protein YkwD
VRNKKHKPGITSLFMMIPLWVGGAGYVRANPPSSAHVNSSQTSVATGVEPPGIFDAGCPGNPKCIEVPTLAREMLALINRDRLAPAYHLETKGLAHPLRWDTRLAQIAVAHTEAMLRRHYFGHVDPNGESPVERFYRAGIQWRSLGENIAVNSTVSLAEDAFMSEPPSQPNHRGNILNPAFNSVGVAAVRAPDGRIYITQDFAEE